MTSGVKVARGAWFALVMVVLTGRVGQADPVYVPGSPIPPGQFASTAIFHDLLDGTATPGLTAVYGLESQEVSFQRTTDYAAASNLRFDGVVRPANVAPGERFLLGYLTYTNGLHFIGTLNAGISIQTYGPPPVPGSFTQTYSDRVFLDITENSGTAEQNADVIWFRDRPDLGSLRVYEGQAAAIELWGFFGSLHLDSFGAVVSNPGSGYYYQGIGEVPDDFVPSATGNGTFIPAAPYVPVPEPTLWQLGALACATLMWRRRR